MGTNVRSMFDKNNVDKISSEVFGCVLRTLGLNHSFIEEKMIKNVDTNGRRLCFTIS